MPAVAHQQPGGEADAQFLSMLPAICCQASLAFRHLNVELREELIAEVVANTFVAFRRLLERGRREVVFATPLAAYAIRQARVDGGSKRWRRAAEFGGAGLVKVSEGWCVAG